VWHGGQYDLIPTCVGPEYIRHDEKATGRKTRDEYAAEIAKTRRPVSAVPFNDQARQPLESATP
jgi:hypothetical protein